MKINVFHHNDLDGYCSKFWFNKFYTENTFEDVIPDFGEYKNYLIYGEEIGGLPKQPMLKAEFNYIPYNYEDIKEDDFKCNVAFFLDCSPNKIDDALKFKKVIILDHHKTALEKYGTCKQKDKFGLEHSNEAHYDDIELIYDEKKSGCEIVREYFRFPKSVFSYLISDYDMWKFEDSRTKEFSAGMHTYDITENSLYERLLEAEKEWKDGFETIWDGKSFCINAICFVGSKIINYRRVLGNQLTKKYAKEVEFFGYKALVMNSLIQNSWIFGDEADNKEIDVLIIYAINPDRSVNISLYGGGSMKVNNLDEIAKKYYNGGGHPRASGGNISFKSFCEYFDFIDLNGCFYL
jgi:oligoribonuclease NrnB/cAMP/cGMP phosphodiesterase (DHH superfamily)